MQENSNRVDLIGLQVNKVKAFVKELSSEFYNTTHSDAQKKNFFMDNMDKAKQAVDFIDMAYEKTITVESCETEDIEFMQALRGEICAVKSELSEVLSKWRDYISEIDTKAISETPVIDESTIAKAMNNQDIKEAMNDLGYMAEEDEIRLSGEQAAQAVKAFTHMVIIKKGGKETSTFFRANTIDEINDALDAIVTQHGEDIDIDLYSVSFTPVAVRKSVRTTFKV